MKNKLREMRNNKKGFTLIEMIVVIVIIAILVALAVPAVMGYVSDAREAKLKSAASAGSTTITTAMAKAESLGELSTEMTKIIEDGEKASGATAIKLCTDDYSTTATNGDVTVNETCKDFVYSGSTVDSLNDLTKMYFEIDGKHIMIPIGGNADAAIIDEAPTPPAEG